MGECVTTVQYALPGAVPQQTTSRMYRASDGRMRVDTGDTSVITDPAAQQAILLDHAKKEARAVAMPPAPGGGFHAGGFGVPGAPPPPSMNVENLGKGYIDGLEVEGRRYILPPPEIPKPPALPPLPAMPHVQAPQVPVPPQAPQVPPPPQAPHPPTVTELWTSTKLQLPVYTKTTAGFGERVSHWKYRDGWQPDPSVFQVPPGYRPPAPPKFPGV